MGAVRGTWSGPDGGLDACGIKDCTRNPDASRPLRVSVFRGTNLEILEIDGCSRLVDVQHGTSEVQPQRKPEMRSFVLLDSAERSQGTHRSTTLRDSCSKLLERFRSVEKCRFADGSGGRKTYSSTSCGHTCTCIVSGARACS